MADVFEELAQHALNRRGEILPLPSYAAPLAPWIETSTLIDGQDGPFGGDRSWKELHGGALKLPGVRATDDPGSFASARRKSSEPQGEETLDDPEAATQSLVAPIQRKLERNASGPRKDQAAGTGPQTSSEAQVGPNLSTEWRQIQSRRMTHRWSRC